MTVPGLPLVPPVIRLNVALAQSVSPDPGLTKQPPVPLSVYVTCARAPEAAPNISPQANKTNALIRSGFMNELQADNQTAAQPNIAIIVLLISIILAAMSMFYNLIRADSRVLSPRCTGPTPAGRRLPRLSRSSTVGQTPKQSPARPPRAFPDHSLDSDATRAYRTLCQLTPANRDAIAAPSGAFMRKRVHERRARRTYPGARTARGRWVAFACLLIGSPTLAQFPPPPGSQSSPGAPTPAMPGDLSRPVFDTRTSIYSPPVNKNQSDRVVAEVEGRKVTLADVKDFIATLPPEVAQQDFQTLYLRVVEQLIYRTALAIRARGDGLDDDPIPRRGIEAAADHILANAWLHKYLDGKITEQMLLARYDRDIGSQP